MMGDFSTLTPHVKAGALRALAVTGKSRQPAYPEIPTMQEAGLPDYEMTFWLAAYAPAKTPRYVVQYLKRAFVIALRNPSVIAFLDNVGGASIPTTPEELMKFQVSEAINWRRIITTAGIQPEGAHLRRALISTLELGASHS